MWLGAIGKVGYKKYENLMKSEDWIYNSELFRELKLWQEFMTKSIGHSFNKRG